MVADSSNARREGSLRKLGCNGSNTPRNDIGEDIDEAFLRARRARDGGEFRRRYFRVVCIGSVVVVAAA